jgi:hypothetical protein
MVEGVEDVFNAVENEVFGGGKGHSNFGGKPGNRVRDALGSCCKHPDGVAPI